MKAYRFIVVAYTLVIVGCDSGKESANDEKHQEQVRQENSSVQPGVNNAESSPAKQPRSPEELAEAYLQAINDKDKTAVEGLIYWNGVENRKSTESWIKMVLKTQLSSVAVTSLTEDFKTLSNNGFDRNGVRFVPNLDVEYVLTPKSEKGDGQISIGENKEEWFIVAYIPVE